MTPIPFGALKIDPIDYASRANAILGIRDSGKTITAKYLAEGLFARGIPFIVFDPSGVWRYLRVPGNGPGLPVVVAGTDGDLPLNPMTAGAIVNAAMAEGVSLVIDLSGAEFSKSDWRRVVKDCFGLLLRKNRAHGLRHLILEEAPEFVPQKPLDGDTYAAVEKVARIGGNAGLGLTLIGQRAAEVNKAVLELCDNLMLHRQRGFRSLENLDKWLDIAGVEGGKDIIKTLSTLPTGVCWAWFNSEGVTAHRVEVPMIQSGHPDRRTLGKVKIKKAVPVESFLTQLRQSLAGIEAEAKANDPATLRAEIARLTKEAAKSAPAVDPGALAAARAEGRAAGFAAAVDAFDALEKALDGSIDKIREAMDAALTRFQDGLMAGRPKPSPANARQRVKTEAPLPKPLPEPVRAALPRSAPARTGPGERVMASLAFWESTGQREPTREQVAAVAGYKPNTGNFRNVLSQLRVAGLVAFPQPGRVTGLDFRDVTRVTDPGVTFRRVLNGPQTRVMEALVGAGPKSRDELAGLSGYQPNTGNYRNILSSLNSMGAISYPGPGFVAAAEWVKAIW